MSDLFDVVVLGGGPGGQIAAIRAAQLGLKTACIDEWKNGAGGPALGGTCTNVGCIPSKALLQSSEYVELAAKHFADHGIDVGAPTVDIARFLARKDHVVKQNNDGIAFLFRKNKITFFHGHGRFKAAVDGVYELEVVGADTQVVTAKNVIIATGSRARQLPQVAFDERRVVSNEGALRLPTVPRRLGVIGAGVVGLELGSVWRRLGAEVTVLEGLPTFLAGADAQVAKEARKAFEKQGLRIELGVRVGDVEVSGDAVSVSYLDDQAAPKKLEVDVLIVSIGRIPNVAGLGLEAIGVGLDARGGIAVDDRCRTNISGVWAIGDVVRGPMLAHKAEAEGHAVAERIAGQRPEVDFNTVPWVIYTNPEIAWVGQTEQQLTAAGRKFKSGTFPFMANGRARAMGDTTGFVKVLADAATDDILGVHVIGPLASEMIGAAVLAMEFRAVSEDVGMICNPHPTLSEALKEAALAVEGRALNF